MIKILDTWPQLEKTSKRTCSVELLRSPDTKTIRLDFQSFRTASSSSSLSLIVTMPLTRPELGPGISFDGSAFFLLTTLSFDGSAFFSLTAFRVFSDGSLCFIVVLSFVLLAGTGTGRAMRLFALSSFSDPWTLLLIFFETCVGA